MATSLFLNIIVQDGSYLVSGPAKVTSEWFYLTCETVIYWQLWPFTRKRAITAFRFRTEFRLEPVWKPFERNLHSFERPGSSVQKNLHPFERLDHPFDRNVQPFEWLAHPFGKSIHPFERLAHPFDKNVQPFERLTHPFVKNIQPFERLAHPFAGTSIRSNDLSMRQSYERLSFPVRVLA